MYVYMCVYQEREMFVTIIGASKGASLGGPLKKGRSGTKVVNDFLDRLKGSN